MDYVLRLRKKSYLAQVRIEHYARQYDFQMGAMLCCIFGKDYEISSRKASIKSLLSPTYGGSPYHTIPPADVIADGWVIPMLRTARSTSLDSLRVEEVVEAAPPVRNTLSPLHEYYKLNYAETLYRWGLIYNKTEVLKYMTKKQNNHKGVEFLSECKNCVKLAKHASCSCCKRLTLKCVICHISVKGSSNCCAICGHGGHTRCMMRWFKIKNICITGCGCRCLLEHPSAFKP